MTVTLLIALLAFLCYSAIRAIRASRQVNTISDFFSFGPNIELSALRRAFQATNTSFTTSFVSLYLFAFSQGYFTFITPIAFFLGIIVYSYFFLPRQIEILAHGHRYPELLSKAADAAFIRPCVAIFVLLSLWMFTFAEVQGLNLFLAQLFSDMPSLSKILPVSLVIALAFYVSRNGYRATTANDKVQVNLIFVGAVALLILSLVTAYRLDWENISTAALISNPFSDFKGAVMFVVEILVGFAFSQLLYYDNWQRLSFYAVQRLQTQQQNFSINEIKLPRETCQELAREVRNEYILGGGGMLLIFSAPIILGLTSIVGGVNSGNMSTLAKFFKTSWTDIPGGSILVILSFLFMLSALLSTAESYIIGFVNCLMEDVFRIRLQDDINNLQLKSQLEGTRVLTALTAVSLVPFLLIHPSFDTLFIYLFYSANGLVGPLVFLTFRRKLKAWTVVASIIFGFVYPLPAFLPMYVEYFPYPGLVPVFVSLVVVGLFSSKRNGE